MSRSDLLAKIETTLRDEAAVPLHKLRQILNRIDAHLTNHTSEDISMAVIDDLRAQLTDLQTNVAKLVALIATDAGGAVAKAELDAQNADLANMITGVAQINAGVTAALNPAPVTADPAAPADATAQPAAAAEPVSDPATGGVLN